MACFCYIADRKLMEPTQQMALILSVIISFLLFYAGCLFVCGDILLKRKGKDNDHYRLAFCHRIWYFLRISFVYDNLTDCIHLHPSDNPALL